MKWIVILLAAVAVSGCASVSYNGAGTHAEVVDYPEIGTVTTAQIGDYMMRKGLNVQEQALSLTSTIDKFTYTIPAGVYKQVGQNEKYWFYSLLGSSGMVTKNPLADPMQALAVPKGKGGQLCVITTLNGKTCYDATYTRKTVASQQSASFQQTLIYNGRVGDKINVGYRELSNDMARPAFNNEVEYDLKASQVIGYKGAQIEVLSADNSSITYKVLRPFAPVTPN